MSNFFSTFTKTFYTKLNVIVENGFLCVILIMGMLRKLTACNTSFTLYPFLIWKRNET